MYLVTIDIYRKPNIRHWQQSALFLLIVYKTCSLTIKYNVKTDSAAPSGGQAKIHLVPDCQFQRFVSYLHVAYDPPVYIIAVHSG